jgi:hypothetical protein
MDSEGNHLFGCYSALFDPENHPIAGLFEVAGRCFDVETDVGIGVFVVLRRFKEVLLKLLHLVGRHLIPEIFLILFNN